MIWWRLVSQCWWWEASCYIWWDAWAAVAALLAVLATIVLGVFTYRLGTAANQATRVAVEIAGSEFQRQQLRDNKERVLVLVQIAGEVSINLDRLRNISDHISQPAFYDTFVHKADAAPELLAALGSTAFPAMKSVTERLHYLEPTVGARVVRVMGLLSSFQEIKPDVADGRDLAEGLRILRLTLPRAVEDLRIIWEACMAAVQELGLADHEFARSVTERAPQ